MKRSTKLGLSCLTLFLGAVVLTGCTASFCNEKDKANILYAYDYGVTNYTTNDNGQKAYMYRDGVKIELNNVFYTIDTSSFGSTYIFNVDSSTSVYGKAKASGIATPSNLYWETMDAVLLGHAYENAVEDKVINDNVSELTIEQIRRPFEDYDAEKGVLDLYGYLKFGGINEEGNEEVYTNFDKYNQEIRIILGDKLDYCASKSFIDVYKSTLNQLTMQYRSCLATDSGDYGAYGDKKIPVQIEGKAWTDWYGLLEFILIWPIGALIDVLTKGFLGAGILNGWSQLLSILIVTVLIRGLMLIFTFKQTQSTAKMNELQPEIQKIQNKYPNANTNSYDKQRMAAEMQKLYKKNHINPISSLLTLFIQFPVFICVWGAMQGSAYLSSGEFLGLRLSTSISEVIFNADAWANGGGVTALVLFLLMSGAQVVSMLLPQWIQKKKAKDVAKLGKNPAKKSQDNKMKWFTYIMMVMIIIMGFSLASGMGVYWLVGALFSIAQTLITQSITNKKSKKGKK